MSIDERCRKAALDAYHNEPGSDGAPRRILAALEAYEAAKAREEIHADKSVDTVVRIIEEEIGYQQGAENAARSILHELNKRRLAGCTQHTIKIFVDTAEEFQRKDAP